MGVDTPKDRVGKTQTSVTDDGQPFQCICHFFGASGRTGRELVQQALAHGDSVTAFVRDPAKFDIQHAHLRVMQGDVVDYASVC